MKLILTHEVSGLGIAGDVVDVKDGYARNYLIPRGLATAWTRGGQKQVESIQRARQARAIKSLDDAKGLKGQLEAREFTITANAAANGRLFGAVTQTDIAEAVQAQGLTLDRRTISVPEPIKNVGTGAATVTLHPEVRATIALRVVAG